MNRWETIQALYLDLLEFEDAERERELRRRCGHDEELFREVCSLLNVDIHPLLDGLAIDSVPLPTAAAQVGETVDRYRLLERIGEGGMGVVYRAERADGAYEQTVALKLVKPGMDSEAVLRRFRFERQILAGLRHPGIARLLDGGLHGDARPYLVVEYVDGESIISYCDRHRLGIDERLRLFEQVCEAVAYAHQNLVVHRDLKPSNIFVTETEPGNPQVKLLDFGIARLLQETEEMPMLTQAGERVLTPAYAAPEQIAGGRVTTATDVYGLGVVLFELLTGERPIDEKELRNLERAVLHHDPPPPSTARLTDEAADRRRTTRAQLKRRLSGDLDTIILKSLRKEPERRYASADGLLSDLIRHRRNMPVAARPDRAGYRIRKFVQRHRAGVAAATAAVVLVLAVAGVAFDRVSRERDRAQLEATKAAAVAAFLQETFAVSDPSQSRGETVTARELLDRGAARIAADLSDQPEIRAQMLHVIGEVYGSLGLVGEADTLLHRALELRQSILSDDHPDLARTLNALGVLYEMQGRYGEAVQVNREAVEILRMHGEEEALANSLHSLAHAQMRHGDLADAERNIREAIDIKRRLYGDVHAQVAYSLNILGDVHLYQHDTERGEPILREVLEMRRRLLGEDHLDVAVSHHNLGAALRNLRRHAEAEEHYRKALPIWEKVYGTRGSEYANTLSHLALMVSAQGRFEEAEALHHEALDLMRGVFGDEHPRLSVALVRLAMSLTQENRLAEAEAVYRDALAMQRSVLGDAHPFTSDWMVRLGNTIRLQGRYAEAEQMLLDARGLCTTLRPTDAECKDNVDGALAELHEARARENGAE